MNGLMRGKKLHQVLTTLSNTDRIRFTKNLKDAGESGIGAIVDIEDMIPPDGDESIGFLLCNWWHIPREDDWWEFRYLETRQTEVSEDEVEVELVFECIWNKQPNDEIAGLTHYKYRTTPPESDWEYEPFDPEFEAARPLTEEIMNHHLPKVIEDRH